MGIATITSLMSLIIMGSAAIGAFIVYKEMKKLLQEQRKIINEYKNALKQKTPDGENCPEKYF